LHTTDPTLREALPHELAEMMPSREGKEGRLRRRLGHAFRKRVEQRFGEDDLYLARAGEDTHRKVALWRVIRGRDTRGRAASFGAMPPAGPSGTSSRDTPGGPATFPLNPATPQSTDREQNPDGGELPAEDGCSNNSDPENAGGTSPSITVINRPAYRYQYIHDAQALAQALAPMRDAPVLGIDTETTGLDPLTDQVRLLQLAMSGQPVTIIDLWRIPKDARDSLRQVLTAPALKLFHNAKFDLQFLYHVGLRVQGPFFDTMLASQLLDAGLRARRHRLADLVQHFLGEDLDKEEQVSDWTQDQLTPGTTPVRCHRCCGITPAPGCHAARTPGHWTDRCHPVGMCWASSRRRDGIGRHAGGSAKTYSPPPAIRGRDPAGCGDVTEVIAGRRRD